MQLHIDRVAASRSDRLQADSIAPACATPGNASPKATTKIPARIITSFVQTLGAWGHGGGSLFERRIGEVRGIFKVGVGRARFQKFLIFGFFISVAPTLCPPNILDANRS